MRPQAVEHVGALTDERMEESLAHVVTAASYLEVAQWALAAAASQEVAGGWGLQRGPPPYQAALLHATT